MVKLWVDDVRQIPDDYHIWCKNARQTIAFLITNTIVEISLDHDLGDDDQGTGYDIACWIEKQAYEGTLKKLKWNIHSANPIGRGRITQALRNADKYWNIQKE